MGAFVARERAESALRFLPQKVAGMEPFHAANFRLILRDFVDHMDRDDVLGHVVAALRRRLPRSGKDWHDASVRAGAPDPLPESAVAALALRYDVLRAVRLEKIDLRYFASSLYPGAHLNEKLMHWKRAIVHPLAADLRTLSRVLLERLPEAETLSVDLDPLVDETLEAFGPIAFGARAWTDADDAAAEAGELAGREAERPTTLRAVATQDASTAPAETSRPRESAPGAVPAPASLDAALAALADLVGACGLDDDARHDLALEVGIVANEATRPGARPRLLRRLAALESRPALAEAVRALRAHLPL